MPFIDPARRKRGERCEDDPDYRRLVEQTGWTPPFVPVKRSD